MYLVCGQGFVLIPQRILLVNEGQIVLHLGEKIFALCEFLLTLLICLRLMIDRSLGQIIFGLALRKTIGDG